jgi:hypothetical protein
MGQVTITVRKNGPLRVDDPTAWWSWWTPMATNTTQRGRLDFLFAGAVLLPIVHFATAAITELHFKRPIA